MSRYKHLIFDWGDTLMVDDSSRDDAMCFWPEVCAVDGAVETLGELSSRCVLSVATGAAQSDADRVRVALGRVGLDGFITRIFVARSMGLKKSDPKFWLALQSALGAGPGDVLAIGDSFESDVVAPVSAGLAAVWFNPAGRQEKGGPPHATIRSLRELLSLPGIAASRDAQFHG